MLGFTHVVLWHYDEEKHQSHAAWRYARQNQNMIDSNCLLHPEWWLHLDPFVTCE